MNTQSAHRTPVIGALLVLIAWSTASLAAESAQEPVRVPFRLIGSSAPLVTIHIRDRDIPLELDIGDGSSLVLHPSVISELNATPTGETSEGYGMEGKIFKVPVLKVDRVKMGRAVFDDVTIHQDGHDDAFRAKQVAERGTRGYVGAGFFKGYELILNYRRHILTLIRKDAEPLSQDSCRGHIVPLMREITWGLVSRVNTDEGDMLFVWDTGSPALVMIKASAAAAHIDTSRDTVTLNHFRMNGHEFGPLRFQIWDFPAPPGMAGFIGYDFFRDHLVCIDFPGNRILVR